VTYSALVKAEPVAQLPVDPVGSEANAIVSFRFDGLPINVIMVDGEPWWIGHEVCKVLGYAHAGHAVERHCKHAKLFKANESLGLDFGPRGVLIIPESDLYRLIMGSRLPDAEKFQDWVVEAVLPEIRKVTGYIAVTEALPIKRCTLPFSPRIWTRLRHSCGGPEEPWAWLQRWRA
jgi:prophage antirepressor-like protein